MITWQPLCQLRLHATFLAFKIQSIGTSHRWWIGPPLVASELWEAISRIGSTSRIDSILLHKRSKVSNAVSYIDNNQAILYQQSCCCSKFHNGHSARPVLRPHLCSSQQTMTNIQTPLSRPTPLRKTLFVLPYQCQLVKQGSCLRNTLRVTIILPNFTRPPSTINTTPKTSNVHFLPC